MSMLFTYSYKVKFKTHSDLTLSSFRNQLYAYIKQNFNLIGLRFVRYYTSGTKKQICSIILLFGCTHTNKLEL